MKASLNWLSAIVGRPLDAKDAADRLTMLGAAVEGMERLHPDLGQILVAQVEQVRRHPDADRLSLCLVNHGTGVVEVVCGAPNVVAGEKYPYAPVGAVLPGGLQLVARKIRGVTSHGMLCSARELGLGTEHQGIMALHTDAPPGTRFLDAMPVEDVQFEIDVTANRPDLLCHQGLARELAAAYDLPLRLPAIPGAPAPVGSPKRVESRGKVDGVEVEIADADGCPRYLAAVIRGVKVGPSPAWLEARLRSIGARPINNVVDATNYILYEVNQPLHAFDLARLNGPRIVVRRAAAGERMVTLDGERRDLGPDMTLICDAAGPVAIAGVMGGAESEVSAATTDILLECAYFEPRRIRRTRQALKLTTEASYRFERGTDLEAMPEAVRRAVALIRAVAGGEEREPPIDVYPRPAKPRSVFLRPARVAHVLGMPLSREEIERCLVRLGFPVAPKDDRLHVQVPGWRPDVTREIDLIEEVARLRGYDAFPVELRPFRPSTVPDDPAEEIKAGIRRVLNGMGLHEARSLSLTAAGGPEAVRVLNPLSADDAHLRADLLGGLVRSAERNWAVRVRDIRLFEIGSVFGAATADGRPRETLRLAGVVSGARLPPHWSASGKSPDYDLWDLRGLFQEAIRLAEAEGELVPVEAGWELRDAAGVRVGWAGTLAADSPAWAAPLLGFELDVLPRGRPYIRYAPVPTTPPVERDLALVLPPGVVASAVETAIREAGGDLLAELVVFDEYRAEALGGRSVAWRLVFRAPDRTLREEEADTTVGKVLAALKERLGVERRQA